MEKSSEEKLPGIEKIRENELREQKESLKELRELIEGSPAVKIYEKMMSDKKIKRTLNENAHEDIKKEIERHPDVKLYREILSGENQVEMGERWLHQKEE